MKRTLPIAMLLVLQAIAVRGADDIKSVQPGRSGERGLAFRITGAAAPDPARVRIFFDVDGPEKGEPASGADYMVEGSTFYRYPAGGEGWQWETIGTVNYSSSGPSVTCLVPNADMLAGAKVRVQITTPEWSVASTWPDGDPYVLPDRATLPEFAALTGGTLGKTPSPVDLAELLRYQPPSLSVRFEKDYLQRDWKPAKATEPAFPLVFRLVDAQSGKEEALVPSETLADGENRLLKGTTAGLDWQIVIETGREGDATVTGRLRGAGERCFSITAAAAVDPAGWTWHDDVRTSRRIGGEKIYATMAGSPYGPEGQVSIYPFGVMSKDGEMIVAETAIAEPRVFRIAADPARKNFGITWDMAISPGTKKFPGAATFQGKWSKRAVATPDAFRAALEFFYEEHPEFARNRAKVAGLWMPFSDISKLPNPEDFGFAFFEKVGEPGSDVDYAHQNNVLTLRYTEPWLYWLPMPAGMPRTPEKAMELMSEVGHSGDARANAFAASGLLGGVRERDGSVRMKFLDVPWNSGARMEVSSHPDLAPNPQATISRAMAEWKDIQGFLSDARTDGIYLDSMSAMLEIDYNPAAIAAADYPLTFTASELTPGLSTQVAAFEFTAALGNYLHDHDKLVMGNFPAYDFPFYMPYIDVPGEETVWFAGGQYTPMPSAKLNYRRAMSGRKVWCFLLGAKFEDIPEGGIERYFSDCLFYGFQPSFFSHNGADDTYWTNAALYERDRPLFKKYMPLIRRIALAGWRPLGSLRAADEALWVENFGDGKDGAVRHANLRNATGRPLKTTVSLADGESAIFVVIEPLAGVSTYLFPNEKTPVELGAARMRAWDIVPVGNLAAEIEFLEKWASPTGAGPAGAENLRSIGREIAEGLYCQVRVTSPAVLGEENPATLELRNTGRDAVTISGFGPGKPLVVPAGKTVTCSGNFREPDAEGWLAFRWLAQLPDGRTLECTRRVQTDFAAPVEVTLEAERVVSRAAASSIGLTLINRSATPHKVTIKWEGDFAGGETEETLAAGETRPLQIPVTASTSTKGFVTVSATAGGAEIFRKKVYVLFAGENTSAAAVSGVQVITDSTYPGYSITALTDGVVDGTNLAWNEAAWASDDNGQPHFIKVVFPSPTELKEATIYWQNEGGVRYASRQGSLVGVTAEGESIELGSFINDTAVPATTVKFPSRKWKSIELRQPANSGAKSRPGILWLSELELK